MTRRDQNVESLANLFGRDGLAAAARMGAFDPFLTTARLMGVTMWGPGIGALVAASAMRFPTTVAIEDEDGPITYRRLDAAASSLAGHFRDVAGDGSVGILARNHKGFVLAQVAAERAGVDVVLLSTALPAGRLRDVIERERISVLVTDDEFAAVVEAAGNAPLVLAAEGDAPNSIHILSRQRRMCSPPRRRSELVLLTSGTTGPPKGARRANKAAGSDGMGMFLRIPYQTGDTFYAVPPLFHALGLSQSTIALATGSTLILRRRFDPNQALEVMTERRIGVLAVVPLMLRRMLDENPGPDVIPPRIVISSGNVLSGSLALDWMDRFGDRLYNLYGSTEAAIGTIADPSELRLAPGTVGRPPNGVTLAILDRKGMPVPIGRRGRVYISNSMQFSGYTDGSERARSGTLLATGDLGFMDEHGLLHVSGRENDMIVTGGENVFPSQVEEVLDQHPDVQVSAVVGLPDEEYGQRITAFVVPRSKRRKVDADELRAFAAENLANFMVPKAIHVVEALPMTTTGKVIRHRLAVLGRADRL
ncbi:MAG: AMP-binding protein [Acidimicrobiales bacterium]